ncbi:gliding motility protein GldB [Geofilum rubicundum]|uniref:GldB protein n=1 Tax=Geofilum rubicundum JCM 15548 TaxID=1236989 RepID=A0A0E9LRM7_9BACT|nr:gliding motility protein GldB [Geofilum rubicundum]GAO28252.1 GldB protein [Geofilum rubicundum JCM 15548]
MKLVFVSSIVTLLLMTMACSSGSKAPDVSHVDVDFELIPFYEDLFAIHPDSFAGEAEALKAKYGQYLEAYSLGVIAAGSTEDEDFVENMQFFLSYEPNQEVLDTCRLVFGDTAPLEEELESAFKYYRYYFPEAEVPDVYLHISGFNQSVVVDSSWISVSVEKYLGRGCLFYEWLSIPVYLRRRMSPEKVVPDVMMALAMTEFAYNDSVDDLLNQMIYEGQLRYFVKQLIPDIPDTTLLDFSTEQMSWVENNEERMWSTIVENKHLFSNDRMTLQRFVGKSPFTYYFGEESPGGTGIYLGYQIVKAYMERHPETPLASLMQMNDGHAFFRSARYQP